MWPSPSKLDSYTVMQTDLPFLTHSEWYSSNCPPQCVTRAWDFWIRISIALFFPISLIHCIQTSQDGRSVCRVIILGHEATDPSAEKEVPMSIFVRKVYTYSFHKSAPFTLTDMQLKVICNTKKTQRKWIEVFERRQGWETWVLLHVHQKRSLESLSLTQAATIAD